MWVEPNLLQIKECLMLDRIPQAGLDCDFCAYHEAAKDLEKTIVHHE